MAAAALEQTKTYKPSKAPRLNVTSATEAELTIELKLITILAELADSLLSDSDNNARLEATMMASSRPRII